LSETLLKLVWVPLTVFLLMGITLPFVSFHNEEIVLLGLLGIILVTLFYVVVATFKSKPNENNQIEQSTNDVKAYFEKINLHSDLTGTNIEWRVSTDFMYLEVVFHNGFPT
jgi:lipopolysaccharide export LptBFGC system permease protein LptF